MVRHEDTRIISFIDVDTWNEAGWSGTLFAVDLDGSAPPAIGLLFTNEAAGRTIFTDLIGRLGNQDDPELLRVSIIEGHIPGEKPGYSVYIGTDHNNYISEMKRKGKDDSTSIMAMIGRCHRMTPAPGSPFLAGFKNAYEMHKKYLLIPAFGDTRAPRPVFELAIVKKQINFLRAEGLGENDVERVVLLKDGET